MHIKLLRTVNICMCTTHHPCALSIYAFALHIILAHCQYMRMHRTSSLCTANTCVCTAHHPCALPIHVCPIVYAYTDLELSKVVEEMLLVHTSQSLPNGHIRQWSTRFSPFFPSRFRFKVWTTALLKATLVIQLHHHVWGLRSIMQVFQVHRESRKPSPAPIKISKSTWN
jgi:hypothetical protein